MMDVVLGFDTSCYTTSVSAVSLTGEVVASERLVLPVESGKRGLRQSEAVFAHVRQIPLVMKPVGEALKRHSTRICAVAASTVPRAEENSYMPVFAVGYAHAKTLAAALGVPCYAVSHQQGHIAAGQIGMPPLVGDFVALHLSGGTTELLHYKQDGSLTLLGGTKDLHAGQLVDRVGVALGLSFPAGPALEALARGCAEGAGALLPASMEGGDLFCHLSGAETKCQHMIEDGALPPEHIALEVYDFLARTVARLLMAGCKAAGTQQALVVGGVASSALLREMLGERLAKVQRVRSKGTRPKAMHMQLQAQDTHPQPAGQQAGVSQSPVKVIFGQPQYSADNAAGVAWLGVQQYRAANESQGIHTQSKQLTI